MIMNNLDINTIIIKTFNILMTSMTVSLVQVIVATLTFLVCILTVWGKHSDTEAAGQSPAAPPAWTVMELVVMTFIRSENCKKNKNISSLPQPSSDAWPYCTATTTSRRCTGWAAPSS